MFKIISAFLQIISLSRKNGKTFPQKLSVFRTIVSLKYNKLVRKNLKNTECTQKILNYSVTAYDYETLHTLFYDIFLLHPYSFKTKNEKPLIIDCGAHIGMSVLYFKKSFPESKIIAFEANPHVYKLLEKNIAANKLKDVTTQNYVLSDTKGKIRFYMNDNIGTFNGSIKKDIGGTTELLGEAMLLSEIIAGIKKKTDLVKIDVEGAESNIISDLTETGLLSTPEQYLIEYHHRTNNERSALSGFLKMFEEAGYNYNLWSRSQIDTCQDILIHCYK
jgi:FkbM family methyltransferase